MCDHVLLGGVRWLEAVGCVHSTQPCITGCGAALTTQTPARSHATPQAAILRSREQGLPLQHCCCSWHSPHPQALQITKPHPLSLTTFDQASVPSSSPPCTATKAVTMRHSAAAG